MRKDDSISYKVKLWKCSSNKSETFVTNINLTRVNTIINQIETCSETCDTFINDIVNEIENVLIETATTSFGTCKTNTKNAKIDMHINGSTLTVNELENITIIVKIYINIIKMI